MIGIPPNGMGLPGAQPGVGFFDPAADPESKRRNMLAQMLLQQNNQPGSGGWADGLSKVASGAMAGMQMGQNVKPPINGMSQS